MMIAKILVAVGLLAVAGGAGVGLGLLEERLDKRRKEGPPLSMEENLEMEAETLISTAALVLSAEEYEAFADAVKELL